MSPRTTAIGCSDARSTMPPARPSTRARGCSGSAIPGAPRWSGSPRAATRRRTRSPVRPRSARGAARARAGRRSNEAWTSPLRGSRPRCSTGCASCPPLRSAARAADLAASYQAAIVDSLLARAEQALDAAGLDRLAVGGGVAANGELRRAAAGARRHGARAGAGAVHGQRGDDRERRTLRASSCPILRTSASTRTRPASSRCEGGRPGDGADYDLFQAGLSPLRRGAAHGCAACRRSSALSCASSTSLANEALHDAYFERIPVVALDGEELFDYVVDEQILRERLESRR